MKKTLFALAMVMTMGLCANAQSDGWFRSGVEYYEERLSSDDINISMPKHDQNTDQGAPLGSGLLILTAMGAGYTLKKRNK